MEHKYTDEEIIKALELHSNPYEPCVSKCPYGGGMNRCGSYMAKDALDLINRQKAEIAFWMDAAANAKKEAVKEFADRLKEELTTGAAVMRISTMDIINEVVKELTEETKK